MVSIVRKRRSVHQLIGSRMDADSRAARRRVRSRMTATAMWWGGGGGGGKLGNETDAAELPLDWEGREPDSKIFKTYLTRSSIAYPFGFVFFYVPTCWRSRVSVRMLSRLTLFWVFWYIAQPMEDMCARTTVQLIHCLCQINPFGR